jgi:NADH dehydrogenase
VINLVGIFHEIGKQKFDSIHHQAAIKIAQICQEENVQTLIHFSALGAHLNASSHYAKTKAEGENRVQNIFPKTVIFRPSLVFGAEDNFFNRFAAIALLYPFLPLVYRGQTQFQPVFVNDIARAVEVVISQNIQGQILELGGSTVYTFKQLMEIMLKTINRSCALIPMPNFIAYTVGSIAQYLPNPILTIDQMRLLKMNNILTNTKPGLNDLGISPKSLEAIIPTYLRRFHS